MNRMNMGTPLNPEGVPHWSNTAMYSHILERRRKKQQGFWLFFAECCGRCVGGGFVENILADVTAVKREAGYGGFIPDVLLERGDNSPIWLEFTHTSPPSASKLAYCASNGIDIFELDGSQRPIDSVVRKAHISPRNCRNRRRQRLIDLWRQIAKSEDPSVGIREDFRSPERQRREREEFWNEVRASHQAVDDGALRCARCSEPFVSEGERYSVSYIETHDPGGSCGEVPFCRDCSFAIGGGWDGVYPGDADLWGLDEECVDCKPFLAEHKKRLDESQSRRSVLMSEPYGSRLVVEPQRRRQEYIVGSRTVSRGELQSVLMMFKFVLTKMLPADQDSRIMLNEVERIEKAVQYANNVSDWDWFEGVGESYVPEGDSSDGSIGDRFLYPKRWWHTLPPCPLTLI